MQQTPTTTLIPEGLALAPQHAEAIDHQWYALSIRPRTEQMVSEVLTGKGYKVIVLMRQVRKQLCDRVKTIKQPLFPGYLFCRFHVTNRLPILITPGIVSILGSGKEPVSVSEEEIAALLRMTECGRDVEECTYVESGRAVEVIRGALRGLRGVVLSQERKTRVVVSITLLRRSIAVHCDRADIRPI